MKVAKKNCQKGNKFEKAFKKVVKISTKTGRLYVVYNKKTYKIILTKCWQREVKQKAANKNPKIDDKSLSRTFCD